MHTAQLMPLPLTVSCVSKIQIGFAFLVPAHPGSPGQRSVKRVCVCVCVFSRQPAQSIEKRVCVYSSTSQSHERRRLASTILSPACSPPASAGDWSSTSSTYRPPRGRDVSAVRVNPKPSKFGLSLSRHRRCLASPSPPDTPPRSTLKLDAAQSLSVAP